MLLWVDPRWVEAVEQIPPQTDMDSEEGALKEEITWMGNIGMYSAVLFCINYQEGHGSTWSLMTVCHRGVSKLGVVSFVSSESTFNIAHVRHIQRRKGQDVDTALKSKHL